MRSREEINKDIVNLHVGYGMSEFRQEDKQEIMIEILLDIRELLNK